MNKVFDFSIRPHVYHEIDYVYNERKLYYSEN